MGVQTKTKTAWILTVKAKAQIIRMDNISLQLVAQQMPVELLEQQVALRPFVSRFQTGLRAQQIVMF